MYRLWIWGLVAISVNKIIPATTGNAIFTDTDEPFFIKIFCPIFVAEVILYVLNAVEPVKYINRNMFILVDKVWGNVDVLIDK